MKLNKQQIESFQKLWLSEFNEEISMDEAEQSAESLLDLLVLMFLSSKDK